MQQGAVGNHECTALQRVKSLCLDAGDNAALVAEVGELQAALEHSKAGSAAQTDQIVQLRAALDRAEAGRAAADR